MGIQGMVDAMNAAHREIRSDYHLTLGDAIKQLHEIPLHFSVTFDWNGEYPNEVMSYRGYYSDLAFDCTSELQLVEDVLGKCEEALGNTYTGYKGGEFYMDTDTPLWVSPYGSGGGRAMMGIFVHEGEVKILTKIIDN